MAEKKTSILQAAIWEKEGAEAVKNHLARRTLKCRVTFETTKGGSLGHVDVIEKGEPIPGISDFLPSFLGEVTKKAEATIKAEAQKAIDNVGKPAASGPVDFPDQDE